MRTRNQCRTPAIRTCSSNFATYAQEATTNVHLWPFLIALEAADCAVSAAW